MKESKIGDYYWAYADILRGIGVPENMYDQRIIAFMALKLVVDNDFLLFSFDYKNGFGLDVRHYEELLEKEKTNSGVFKYLLKNINDYTRNEIGSDGCRLIKRNNGINFQIKKGSFTQLKKLNPKPAEKRYENVLEYFIDEKTFNMINYIDELEEHYFEMVLDIYIDKANFVGYPKEKYKDLYETTISRMKKLTGSLTGQHFTQKSIIHLMCESVVKDFKKNKRKKLAIYDPTCGVASMLIESAFYFKNKLKDVDIEVYGQEYNKQTWLLAKIFLAISDIPNEIACGNTLTVPAFKSLNGDDSFDFIIANPPFGIDWKHDYKTIVEDLEKKESNFSKNMLSDGKDRYVLPKKSDGQFLFIAHIVKLLEASKNSGKRAKAAVISSTGLLTSGKATSSEGIIRKNMFSSGIVDTVIEQPKSMFTNTDISTLIWFLDNRADFTESQMKKIINKTFVMKVDPTYVNKFFKNVEIKCLFSDAEHKVDKQKNGYSEQNIKDIIFAIENKTQMKPFFMTKEMAGDYTINFDSDLALDVENKITVSSTELENAYKVLNLSLMIGDDVVESKHEGFKEVVKRIQDWIDGIVTDGYKDEYMKAYEKLFKDKAKKKTEKLVKEMAGIFNREQEEMKIVFNECAEISKKFNIGLV